MKELGFESLIVEKLYLSWPAMYLFNKFTMLLLLNRCVYNHRLAIEGSTPGVLTSKHNVGFSMR